MSLCDYFVLELVDLVLELESGIFDPFETRVEVFKTLLHVSNLLLSLQTTAHTVDFCLLGILALAKLDLVIDSIDVLSKTIYICLQIECLSENLLTIR